MKIQIGQKFVKLSYLTVTDYNEATGVVKGVNDAGAEIVITEDYMNEIYVEDTHPDLS